MEARDWAGLFSSGFPPRSQCVCVCVCVCVSRSVVSHSLWPMNCSPPGFSVHGIPQARILEWIAISYSREYSWPKNWTHLSYISCIGRRVLYHLCHLGSPVNHYLYSKWFLAVVFKLSMSFTKNWTRLYNHLNYYIFALFLSFWIK